jgi:hypothetical protein
MSPQLEAPVHQTRLDQPLASADIAQLVAVSMRLAMEVATLRDRLATHEALLAKNGSLNSLQVDMYIPNAAEQAQRDTFKRELIVALSGDIHGA